jgi:hypothetical protein
MPIYVICDALIHEAHTQYKFCVDKFLEYVHSISLNARKNEF